MSASLELITEKREWYQHKTWPPALGGKLRQYAHSTARSTETQGVYSFHSSPTTPKIKRHRWLFPNMTFLGDSFPILWPPQRSCLGPWGRTVPLNDHMQSKRSREAAKPPLAQLMVGDRVICPDRPLPREKNLSNSPEECPNLTSRLADYWVGLWSLLSIMSEPLWANQ